MTAPTTGRRPGRRWWVVAAVVVVGIVVVALLLRPASRGGHGGGGPAAVGNPAPALDGVGLDGRRVRLSDLRGRTVLVNFWASWCTPCRQEFPVFRQLLSAGGRVAVVGVVFQDGRTPAAAFARSEGATWASVTDPSGRIASAYGVTPKPGIPVTFAVDASGVVRAKHLGPLTSLADAQALAATAGAAAPSR